MASAVFQLAADINSSPITASCSRLAADELAKTNKMKMGGKMTKAKIISDISNISIRKLKEQVKKFSVEVVNVSPGNMNGGEYEVTFSGKKSDLISYAHAHLGFDGNTFNELREMLNMEGTI